MSRPAQLCTVADLAACLKVSRSHAYRLLAEGALPVVHVGSAAIRVLEQDVAEFVAKNRETSQ